MGPLTAEQIAQRAFDLGLIDERQLQEVWGQFGSHEVSLDDFVQTLVRREIVTNYQVERLVKGDRTGFFFGDYKVLYLVGSGTFARVYRAVHKHTGQVAAVKVLRKRYSENPVHYRQFVREGSLGRTLRHENIVPIYEVFSKGNVHFLVMEFVEGRNLRQFVKIRKKIEPPEAVRLMIDITGGLRYAFERGMTHRDLKISNVLVSSRGTAKLVDFGLASVDADLSNDVLAEITNSRTIDYAALERATGVRKDDTRSDIYFLGCIFYHMLTGRPALKETRDRVQRLSKSRFLEVVPIQRADSTTPHSVSLVVNKTIMLDPDRRYQTPGAVLSDLKIAARRLAEQKETAREHAGTVSSAVDPDRGPGGPGGLLTGSQPSVMVVESNAEMQDVFRSSLKRAGYRVLLTSAPERALVRFQQEPTAADCVVFNAQEIGEPALEMFNRFAEGSLTEPIPAVLLLDEPQHDWRNNARTAEHRVVVNMPVTMKQLRRVLAQLVPAPSV